MSECDHNFQGWREHADGLGGEQFCSKCGLGAMAHTIMLDWDDDIFTTPKEGRQ